MKRIPLNKGLFALVDDEDCARLGGYHWFVNHNGYAVRATSRRNPPRRQIFMHREILCVPAQLFADHIDGNRLDNRRSNLRIATKAQNGYNRSAIRRNKLGAKGISYDSDRSRYRVRVSLEGHCFQLGRCRSLPEARELYAAGAAFFHGEFARTE